MADFNIHDKIRISPNKDQLKKVKNGYQILAGYSGKLVAKEPDDQGNINWFVQIKNIRKPVLLPENLLILESLFEYVENAQTDFDTFYRNKQQEIWNKKMR